MNLKRMRAIKARVQIKTLAVGRKILPPRGAQAKAAVPAFLVGCGRSGTNMVVRRLSLLWQIEQHNEDDTAAFDKFRLRDMATIKQLVARSRADVILFKPILDTHMTRLLLDTFPEGRVVFMVRHYSDVINSSLRRFGAGDWPSRVDSWIENDFAEFDSARPPAATREAIRSLWHQSLTAAEKVALYWLFHNRLFFDLNLHTDRRVLPVQYEATVSNPEGAFRSLCEFLGAEFQSQLLYNVTSDYIGKESKAALGDQLLAACETLWNSLCEQTGQAMLPPENGQPGQKVRVPVEPR